LKSVAKSDRELTVYVELFRKGTVGLEQHERTAIPSQLILHSPVISIILDLLNQGLDNAKRLLDFLPTVPQVTLKVKEMCQRRTFDWFHFLPRDLPAVFEYNFESLTSGITAQVGRGIERTNGLPYIIESLSPTLSRIVLPYLQALPKSLKLKFGQLILDTIVPLLPALMSLESKSIFSDLVNYAASVAKLKKSHLVFPERFFDLIQLLLFSDQHHIRLNSSQLFSRVEIPLSVFLNLIPLLTPSIEAEFFPALLPHVSDYIPEIVSYCFTRITSAPCLTAFYRFLSNGFLAPEMIDELNSALLLKYLRIESGDRDKEAFLVAVRLLAVIESDSLLAHLSDLHEPRRPYVKWRIDGDATAVSSTGRSGLLNLGATCFLNSTLQQFYAIVPLRNRVIEYNGTDPFMWELQKLYARMLLSRGYALSPEDLVKTWQNWDGTPMNPRLQQDACEFVQMLIDKLENGIGHDVLHAMFRGTTIDTITGLTDDYVAHRDQQFYTFTLPIAGSTNASEAFEKFLAIDYLTGPNQYLAEPLGRKINAKKFSSIGNLPPHLVIQLGRFTYNFQTWEQVKIDTPFEFPLDLDVEPYTLPERRSQIMKYFLTGVIVHSGVAQCGHYISLMRDNTREDRWFCFNDTAVTEMTTEIALRMSYGHHNSRNAYLLFYQREDVFFADLTDPPAVPQDLQTEIEASNRLNDEYRLYCSSAYFELMQLLVRSSKQTSHEIAPRYFFDTFAFTTHIAHARTLSEPLIESLTKSEDFRCVFAAFLSCNDPYACPLIYSSDYEIRSATRHMIETLEGDKFTQDFLGRLHEHLQEILTYYQGSNEYFELCDSLIRLHENVSLYVAEEEHNWVERFSKFLVHDIPEYLKCHPEVPPVWFWSNANLTGLFKVLTTLSPPGELLDQVLQDEFFKSVFSGSPEIYSFVAFLKSFGKPEQVREFSIQFAHRNGIQVPYLSLVAFLLELLHREAFSVIPVCCLRVGESSPTDQDFACAIACYLSDNHDFGIFLVENLDLWIINLLTNEIEDCRAATRHIIAFLVPHTVFSSIGRFPAGNFETYLGSIGFSVRTANEAMKNRAQAIFRFLQDLAGFVIEREVTRRQGKSTTHDYILVIKHLSTILDEDCTAFFTKFLERIVQAVPPLDAPIREIVAYLAERGCVTPDLVVNCFDPVIEDKAATVQRILQFVECIGNVAAPPAELAKKLLDFLIFTRTPHVSERVGQVIPFVEHVLRAHPDIFHAYLSENLDRIIVGNYSALLLCLELLGAKMPILEGLPLALDRKQFFSMDQLVCKAFACNSGEVQNAREFLKLLCSPQFGKEAREFLWSAVQEGKPSISEFRDFYRFRGDWANQTRLLIEQLGNENVEDLLLECIENSSEAFAISLQWFIEHAKDLLLSREVSEAILQLEITGYSREFAEFVRMLVNGKRSEEIDDLIAPFVSSFKRKAEFLCQVLEDVAEGELTAQDLAELVGPLEVIEMVEEVRENVREDILTLEKTCSKEEVAERVRIRELAMFIDLLRKCIPVENQ
jgi:ubiquitin C-terminal hydrolase